MKIKEKDEPETSKKRVKRLMNMKSLNKYEKSKLKFYIEIIERCEKNEY